MSPWEKETFLFASSEEATAVGSRIIISVGCKFERLSDRNFIKTIPEGDPLQSAVVKVFLSRINDGHSVLVPPRLPEEVALFPSLSIYRNVTWIYSILRSRTHRELVFCLEKQMLCLFIHLQEDKSAQLMSIFIDQV
uniref:Uncharacterized protein n=1 Tax=Micrurus lemniscatus lemniscatus TaxID=129467 RepID=A0A2D4JQ19_MICLE